MAIIRSYNQPTAEARGLSGATLPNNAPLGAFGNTMQTEGDAKVLLMAGEQLGKASDAIEKIARAMTEEALVPRRRKPRSARPLGKDTTPMTATNERHTGGDAFHAPQAPMGR